MTSHFFNTSCAGEAVTLHYRQWGVGNAKPVIAIHGLTGSSDDFKFIGEEMAALGYTVYALDMPGRGQSGYLQNKSLYIYANYVAVLFAFLAHLNLKQVDWLGTSMGGLLGIAMAALPDSPVKRLFLNDVGPEVPQSQLEAIATYLERAPVFTSIPEAVAAFKLSIGSPFYRGDMTEEEWTYYAQTHIKQREDGLYSRSFDAGILQPFKDEPLGTVDLWQFWDNITQPVLAVRGALSLLFTDDIAQRMLARKQGAPMDYVVVENAGHVPAFYNQSHIKYLTDWLKKTD